MTRIAIIVGSTRPNRNAPAVADWVYKNAQDRTDAEFELVDIADYDLPLLDEPNPPAMGQYENEHTKKWAEKIASFDGYIFVTPEYNHSVPGPFKNAFDSLGSEWSNKPVAFVGYGSAGAVRAVEHWRNIVANLSMFDVRNQLDLSLFTEFDDNGAAPNERRPEEMTAIFDELERLAGLLQG